MKKSIALVTLCIMLCMGVCAENDEAVFDDFESYSMTEGTVSGGNQSVAESWVISNVYKGWNGGGKAAIIQNSDAGSKELMISGCGNNDDPNNAVCVNYVGDTSAVVGDARIQAELRSIKTGEIGIRFMVSADENSYYEMRCEYWGGPMTVTKATNGVRTPLGTVEGSGGVHNGLKRTLSLSLGGNTLTATVVKEVENGPAETYTNSFTDETPLRADGNNTKCQLVVAGDNSEAYFDNFSYKAVDTYVDLKKEPDNVLYYEVTAAQNADGVYILKDDGYSVRKIEMFSESPSSLLDTKVYVQEVGAAETTEIGEVSNDNLTDTGAVLVNTVTAQPAVAVSLSSIENIDQIKVYTDIASGTEIEVVGNGEGAVVAEFKARIGGKVFSEEWKSSAENIITVEDGMLRTNTVGRSTVSIAEGDISLEVNIIVSGEIETAINAGSVDEYIAEKKPFLDEINTYIKEKDARTLSEKIQEIMLKFFDFDASFLKHMEQEEILSLSNRLITYPVFCAEAGTVTLENIYALLETVSTECAVGELEKASDIATLKLVLGQYNEYYALDLENEAYTTYQDDVCTGLSNQTFENIDDVRAKYADICIMILHTKIVSVDDYKDFIIKYGNAIGYDKEKFDSIKDKTALCEEILRNKNSITDTGELKEFINNYKPESAESGSSNNPHRGSGSSGGIGGRKNAVAISAGGNRNDSNDTDGINGTITGETEAQIFNDVSKVYWAYEYIMNLAIIGVLNGYEDGRFCPESSITRAEFIKALISAFDIQDESDETQKADERTFADVSEDAWYYTYIKTAIARGIINGNGENRINPEEPINREEMAAVIYRTAQALGITLKDDGTLYEFADTTEISEWAYRAVRKLQAAGILNGNENGFYRPLSNVTRGEAAKAIALLIMQEV